MKNLLFVFCAAAFLISGAAVADDDTDVSAPIELSAEQMDQITAGSLKLPNGNVVHDNYDNPAPNVNGYLGAATGLCDTDTGAFCHPALTRRSDTALDATLGHGPSVGGVNDGPWAATQVPHGAIEICGAPVAGPC